MKSSAFSATWRAVLIAFILAATPVLASEHEGGAAAGPAPMQFVVNVGRSLDTMVYLQISIMLDFANPEAARRIAERMPKVQHQIILLLTGEDSAQLQTVKGKQDLQEKIAKELNDLIGETPKTGVKEVYFTNFIMQ